MEKASAGDAEFSLGSLKAVIFRPLRGLVPLSLLNPRLTAWAAFFRRFAAAVWLAASLADFGWHCLHLTLQIKRQE
jgi:hypothetical protein